MIVDASAVCAIAFGEPERELFVEAIKDHRLALITPVQVWEAAVSISNRLSLDGISQVDRLLTTLGVEVAPIGQAETFAAFDVWRRFGRGRHPAGLNLGDCFAYALAKTRDLPLLYKGEDFAKTDIRAAL